MDFVKSVTGIVFSQKRDQVLLIKRRDVPVWVLPGGGVELGESPDEAILREMFEETGLRVKIKQTIGLYIPINRLTKTTKLYECEVIGGELHTSPETKEVRFFPLSSLPRLLPPPYDVWIQDSITNPPIPLRKNLDTVTYGTLLKNLLKHPLLVMRFLLARCGLPLNW